MLRTGHWRSGIMSFLDRDIRLPGEKIRGYLLLAIAVISGLIPDTYVTETLVYCVIPAVLGGVIAAYWTSATLGRKVLLSLAASCGSYFLRSFTTWFVVGFNVFDRFLTADSIWYRAFLILLAWQLFLPVLALIPLHFLCQLLHKRKVSQLAVGGSSAG
jgi:hypothetical protein